MSPVSRSLAPTLALLLFSVASLPGGAVADPAPPLAPFDARWADLFGPDCFFYMAVRDVKMDGPLLRRLTGTEGLDRATTAPGPREVGDVATFLRKATDRARQEKLIDKELHELYEGGFTLGLSKGLGTEPSVVMAMPRSSRLDKFFTWLIPSIRKDQGEKSLEDVVLKGAKGVRYARGPAGMNPVLVQSRDYLIAASDGGAAEAALARAQSPAGGLSSLPMYTKARSGVATDSGAFAVVAPSAFLQAVARSEKTPERKAGQLQLAQTLLSVASGLVQVKATSQLSSINMTVFLDKNHAGFSRYATLVTGGRALRAPGLLPADTSMLVNFVRPIDLTVLAGNTPKEKVDQNVQMIKGQLLQHTGLDFDTQVAPWWGREVALMVQLGAVGSVPAGAMLFESIDVSSSRVAVNKVMSHLKYTQARTITEKKVGDSTLHASQPTGGQAAPVNPALAIHQNFVVVGSAEGPVEATLGAGPRLATSPAYRTLASTPGSQNLIMSIFVNGDVLARGSGPAPTAPPGAPPAQERAIDQLAKELGSIVVGMGTPDMESIGFTILLHAR